LKKRATVTFSLKKKAMLRAADTIIMQVDNASGAINALLRSLPLKAGDILLDFAVVYQPFAEFYSWLEATRGVTVVTVPMTWPLNSTQQVTNAFRETLLSTKAAGRHVAYAVVSHISSYPCIKMPIAELAKVSHEHGVPIIVDGAHALGNIPVDLSAMGVDFWFGNGCALNFLHLKLEIALAFHRDAVPYTAWHTFTLSDGHSDFLLQWCAY
jgi:isopenicillin-N epimerase